MSNLYGGSLSTLDRDLVDSLIYCSDEEYHNSLKLYSNMLTGTQTLMLSHLRREYGDGENPVIVSNGKELIRGECVYLMKATNGLYKIGITKNVRTRLRQLKDALPVDLECEHQIMTNASRALEKELHIRFKAKHFAGEWFVLSQADIDYIKSL